MASSSETTKPKASPTKQVNFEEKHDTKFIEKKRRSNPDMYEPHSNPAKIKGQFLVFYNSLYSYYDYGYT
jgi:hypothetical protein